MELDDKGGAMSDALAFNFDFATHLLNKVLTYAQSKACSCLVVAFLIGQLAEVQENALLVFLGYTMTWVFDSDFKTYKIFLKARFTQDLKLLGDVIWGISSENGSSCIFLNAKALFLVNDFLAEYISICSDLNSYVSILWSKFKGIRKEVEEYLGEPWGIT